MKPEEIAAARARGEVCPAKVVQSGEDQDGRPVERTLECNMLIGHEDPHQAIVPGNSTQTLLVWDKIQWGP